MSKDERARPGADDATTSTPRAGSRAADGTKAAQRRHQLALAAMQTLARRGYARTGLREIAASSDFSHGVLHYYFRDKGELIGECLRLYMAACTVDHDEDVAAATDPATCAALFADSLAATIEQDAPVHRLWFDLRNQATFEPAIGAIVDELSDLLAQRIWRVVTHYADLGANEPLLDRTQTYLVLDGLYRGALERFVGGDAAGLDDFRAAVQALLPGLVRPRTT